MFNCIPYIYTKNQKYYNKEEVYKSINKTNSSLEEVQTYISQEVSKN